MATTQDYAALSLYVYSVSNEDENRPRLPTGWSELQLQKDNTYGFSYGVFSGPRGEIVVSYTGTNEGVDWASNIGSGAGLGSPQMTAAAVAYLEARDQYGSNITFSGHSLGGGLASVMSVWFDRPAVVFDHAPFELSARNPLLVLATKAALASIGYDLGAFLSYNEILTFSARERNVSGSNLGGEALEYLRLALPTIGTSQSLSVGAGLDAVQLHSMALYTAAKLSPTFTQATLAHTNVLPLVMEPNLYASNTGTSSERNFLLDLIRSEQQTLGNSKLSHFAADMNKLGTDLSGLNAAAQTAMIAQGIEWYYWQSSDYAGVKEFFTKTGQLLQYTSAKGDGLVNAQNKASIYTTGWLAALQNAHGADYSPTIKVDYDQWNVAISSTGVTATAKDDNKSQVFAGGAGGDTFTGGSKADTFLAGAGDDIVNGGGGNDLIYGGAGADALKGEAGFDTYHVDSEDTITDTGGQGEVHLGRNKLGLATRKKGETIYKDDNGNKYLLEAGVLTVNGGLKITDFTSGDLGIVLKEKEKDLDSIKKKFDAAEKIPSPIALDLDGNGVQTRSLAEGAHFDHASDGFAELTGWVDEVDGLLVRDLDGNGAIDSGKELFGSETLLTTGANQGKKAANGFEALRELDTNGNGKIDAGDTNFDSLRIWQDANSNAVTDDGELLTLAEASVQSINVGYTAGTWVDAQSNAHLQLGSYTTAEGVTRAAEDVWFKVDNTYGTTTEELEVSADIAALPNATGYGKVRDLHQAMVFDIPVQTAKNNYLIKSGVSRKANSRICFRGKRKESIGVRTEHVNKTYLHVVAA